MSRLDDLIAELCPDGVEYKTLKEIATDIYRGSGIKRDEVTESGIPCVRYGEIYTTYNIWFDECVSHTDENKIANKKYFEYGDILFAITGESVEDIAKSIAYVGHEKCLAGGDIVVMKHNEDPKYLAYALSTTDARSQKSKGKVKSKVVHSSVPAIQDISVPVPPLEVQREIVRVLDHFTLLSAELSAELKARKQQYEYYTDRVFLSENNALQLPLTELVDIRTGKLDANARTEDGEYPFFTCDAKPYRIDKYAFDDEAILVSGNGSQIGHVNYYNGKFNAYQRTYVFTGFVGVIPKYLLLYLKRYIREYCMTNAKKGSVPYITLPMLKNFKVILPSLERQREIVDILDKFATLCDNISEGLPAEIQARQNQYEYYRDNLLSFKEKRN